MVAKKQDRLFNPNGRKHYRRKYNLTEVRIGAAIVLMLGGVLAWVLYKGQYPDPEIYASSPGQANRAPTKAVERGPVPKGLAMEGWREGELSTFDDSNLYEKIDGREGFYKSFGFQRLYFIALAKKDDLAVTVDIELYDLGSGANALGAFSGEIPPNASPEIGDGGLSVIDRNALFMTRGRFYARGIGADESEAVKAQLAFTADTLAKGLEGEALPWSYALFVSGLGINPGKVSYQPENAFGFSFASDVHTAMLEDGETEVFVVSQADAAAATALAKSFDKGFLQYGEVSKTDGGVKWVADRYLNRVSGAKAADVFVVGVRSAEDVEKATAALAKLEAAVAKMSPEQKARALDKPKITGSSGYDDAPEEAPAEGEPPSEGEPSYEGEPSSEGEPSYEEGY
ncbi:MAG: hypothetical protein RIT81_35765 [Deltaproteobacteria bacterium]